MRKIGLFMMIFFLLPLLNLSLYSEASALLFIEKGEINGVPYITGGVGLEERQAMQKMAGDYNLKIVLAAMSGPYLSDLMVTIEDPGGRLVFECTTSGPWLYVDLPSSKYKLTVSYKQEAKTRNVQVDQTLQTVIFHWKE